jgi:hypothetical protein
MKTIVKNKDGMTKNNKRHYLHFYDIQEDILHNKKDSYWFQHKRHCYYKKHYKYFYYYFNDEDFYENNSQK